LVLISTIHTDFLHHWQIQGDTSQTGMSFVYKWLGYGASILLYCLYHLFRNKKSHVKSQQQQEVEQELAELSEEDDPFAAIRARKKLRSRADFMIDNSEDNKS